MEQNLYSLIQASLPHFVPAEATEESVYELLVANQVHPDVATQIVVFVPVAFGRVYLRKFTSTFPQTFTLHYPNEQVVAGLLFNDEPVYRAATLLAEDIIASGSWQAELHFEVAAWSSEIDGFSQALVEGYAAEAISLKELNVFGDLGPRLTL